MYFIRIFMVTILMLSVAETLGAHEECKDDPNAKIGCAGRCHRTCNDFHLASKPHFCPHACIPACDCVSGYVYDSYIKKCVNPEKCSPEALIAKTK